MTIHFRSLAAWLLNMAAALADATVCRFANVTAEPECPHADETLCPSCDLCFHCSPDCYDEFPLPEARERWEQTFGGAS